MKKKLLLLFAIIVIFIFSIAIIFLLYINKNNSKLIPDLSLDSSRDIPATDSDGSFPASEKLSDGSFADPSPSQSSITNNSTPEMAIDGFASAIKKGNFDEALKYTTKETFLYQVEFPGEFQLMSQNEREALADAMLNSVRKNGISEPVQEAEYVFTIKKENLIVDYTINLIFDESWAIRYISSYDNLIPEMVINAYASAVEEGDVNKALEYIFRFEEREKELTKDIIADSYYRKQFASAIRNATKKSGDDRTIIYKITAVTEDGENIEDTFRLIRVSDSESWKLSGL